MMNKLGTLVSFNWLSDAKSPMSWQVQNWILTEEYRKKAEIEAGAEDKAEA